MRAPGKVFTRETLLSRVWGYEYYGGARTVDVHIRRLRAKLGEEHAKLIQTVRSVGYRFGQSRWSLSARGKPPGRFAILPARQRHRRGPRRRPVCEPRRQRQNDEGLPEEAFARAQAGRTSCAWSPFGPATTSNSTA